MMSASMAHADLPPPQTHAGSDSDNEPDQVNQDPYEDAVQIKVCLHDAEQLKQQGNDFFREKKWEQALNAYRAGLGRLPKRREKGKGSVPNPIEPTQDFVGSTQDSEPPQHVDEAATSSDIPVDTLENDCAKARSIMNANIGACYVKLDDHKEAVKACTAALHDDSVYVKAMQRRAASNEKINSWTSLSSAQEDYNALLALLPPSSPQAVEIKRSLQRLKPRIEAAQKQETGEMLDKLKGLGNNILGNFGLSTDNFKFEPNGQGGYSMNFTR